MDQTALIIIEKCTLANGKYFLSGSLVEGTLHIGDHLFEGDVIYGTVVDILRDVLVRKATTTSGSFSFTLEPCALTTSNPMTIFENLSTARLVLARPANLPMLIPDKKNKKSFPKPFDPLPLTPFNKPMVSDPFVDMPIPPGAPVNPGFPNPMNPGLPDLDMPPFDMSGDNPVSKAKKMEDLHKMHWDHYASGQSDGFF